MMIAAEGDEMALPCVMKALQSPRHEGMLSGDKSPTQAKSGLEWAT
jgi:hypothetical protein